MVITEFIEMAILGFVVGLTGALAPGPTLIATINASLKKGWSSGPSVTLGHAIVEAGMVALILTGLSMFIGNHAHLIILIGGSALVFFGILTVMESRTARKIIPQEMQFSSSPVLAGIVTSISNPYFWLWWITVGSALLVGALQGGIVIAIAFILGHWSADLGWLTLVSFSIHKGKFVLGEKLYRWTIRICGVFLVCFGIYYLSTADIFALRT